MDEVYTFWKLINEYKITVPMIQRDYVQGKNISKINEIRENFLADLMDSLKKQKKLDLNFIYGSTNEEKNLTLLDGQQRITTLYLLHWYFAKKEKIINEDITNENSKYIKDILKKFSYQNRTTSEEFCQALVEGNLEIDDKKNVSTQIMEKTWFFNDWKSDPTIKNMLNMLDEIHKKFKEIKNGFKLLTENDYIYFSFIELKKYKLTDELYIKMNSRGKKLTNFEIFKAKFSELIKNNSEMSEKEKKELLEVFNINIEKNWIDLFWEYRNSEDKVVDNYIMRYIYFITEMLYAIDEKIDKGPKENRMSSPFEYENELILNSKLLEETYKNKENIKKMIDILNIWKCKKDIDIDINNTFSNTYEKGKIALLDENYNLFEKCIYNKKMDWFSKNLLFAFIILKLENTKITESEKDLIRVYRNLLWNQRRFDLLKETYAGELRFGEIRLRDYSIFESIKNSKEIYNEIENFLKKFNEKATMEEVKKAKILREKPELKEYIHECEDTEITRGNLINILPLFEKYDKKEIVKFIKMLEHNNEDKTMYSLFYRALLIFSGDYGIFVGGSKYRYFYGNSNEIYAILTYSEKENGHLQHSVDVIQKGIEQIFIRLKNIDDNDFVSKLKQIINDNYNTLDKNSWIYYLAKYEQIWQDENYYTFSFGNQDKNSLTAVNHYQARAANSKFINIFYKIIKNLLPNDVMCNYVSDEDDNFITLKNKEIKIKIEESGFKIITNKNKNISINNIEFNNKLFNENDDYIERFVKLVNKIKIL